MSGTLRINSNRVLSSGIFLWDVVRFSQPHDAVCNQGLDLHVACTVQSKRLPR